MLHPLHLLPEHVVAYTLCSPLASGTDWACGHASAKGCTWNNALASAKLCASALSFHGSSASSGRPGMLNLHAGQGPLRQGCDPRETQPGR